VPIGRIHTLQHQCPRWHCTNGCAACSGDRKFHVEFHPTTYSLNRCGTGCMMMASRQLQFTTASKQCVECNHSSFAQAMLCKPTVVLFITFYAIISCDLVTLPSASCAACCHRCYVWLFTTDTLDVRLDLILSWFLLSVSQSVAQSVSQSTMLRHGARLVCFLMAMAVVVLVLSDRAAHAQGVRSTAASDSMLAKLMEGQFSDDNTAPVSQEDILEYRYSIHHYCCSRWCMYRSIAWLIGCAYGWYSEVVREMMYHAYDQYMLRAYPHDELRPLQCRGRFRDPLDSRGSMDDALGLYEWQSCINPIINQCGVTIVLADINHIHMCYLINIVAAIELAVSR
jgi:hypothetical protein